MGPLLYERPREKLRHRGVKALSRLELLQLVMGSGSRRVPVSRLARSVEKLMQQNDVRYETLVHIHGLGDAKACQILAALELAQR